MSNAVIEICLVPKGKHIFVKTGIIPPNAESFMDVTPVNSSATRLVIPRQNVIISVDGMLPNNTTCSRIRSIRKYAGEFDGISFPERYEQSDCEGTELVHSRWEDTPILPHESLIKFNGKFYIK